MSGHDDDLPEYLRGVQQQAGFEGPDDNYTLRPGDGGAPLDGGGFDRYADPLGDEEDDDEPKPSVLGPIVVVGGGITLVGGLLLLLGGFAVAMWAGLIQSAEADTQVNAEQLVQVVVEQKKIVDELGARGGNRAELESLLAAVDSASGIDKGFRALDYTHAVQDQIVQIGDLRNTPVQPRQYELDLAQDRLEASVGAWRTAAGNPLGQVALAFGLANPPPEL